MGFFSREPAPANVHISIATPVSVTQDDVFLDVEVSLYSDALLNAPTVKAHLRADLSKKSKAKGASPSYMLGGAEYSGEVSMIADKPTLLNFHMPLDFGPMALFDIPSANAAMASPEMQAAMAAAQEINQLYTYCVEVIVKTPDHEYVERRPIELIHPNSARVATFK